MYSKVILDMAGYVENSLRIILPTAQWQEERSAVLQIIYGKILQLLLGRDFALRGAKRIIHPCSFQ